MTSAPPSNELFAAQFRLTRRGAVATRKIKRSERVGVFLYYQWDVVGVLAQDLAPGVGHHIINNNCKLLAAPTDPTTVFLVATRDIPAGEHLLMDYRFTPWWVAFPPKQLALSPRLLDPQLYLIGPSIIHGNGALAATRLGTGASVGVCIRYVWFVLPVVTRELGRHINHSPAAPSCKLVWRGSESHVIAVRDLAPGDEVTLDYATLPWYCRGPPIARAESE